MMKAIDPESVGFVICSPIAWGMPQPGDLHGHCIACKRHVYWSPAAPKRPARICLPCAVDRMEQAHGKDDPFVASLRLHVTTMSAKPSGRC
jgi:hypothetical protein